MTHAWPEPVERVAAFLREAGAEARLEQLDVEAPSAQAAAEAIGCGLDQIVKTVLLLAGGEPVAVLVPGDRRCDTGKAARALGQETARVAAADDVVAATGFAPGGVAPFPLPDVERTLVERTILSSPVVWVGAGSDRHVVALAPAELLRLTRGETVDVVQESA
mgnify:CR=1 FL=1